MDALRAAHPRLQVDLPQSTTNIIIEDVRAGRIDGGFAYVAEDGPSLPPELTGLHLATTSLHVVAPPAWAERLNACAWADLAREPWVWFTDACPCCALLERQLLPFVSEIRKVAVTDYEGTLKALVSSGAGLGLMQGDEARNWARAGEVCIWPHAELSIGIYFLMRADRAGDPALRAMLKTLRQVWELDPGDAVLDEPAREVC
jgi:DNA-binding transcriptional LysR family regulator